MMRLSSIPVAKNSLLAMVVCVFVVSCGRKTVVQHSALHSQIALTDDTSHNYAVDIVQNHRFAYTVSYGSLAPDTKREYYDGSWQYRSDTLFLSYKGASPPGVAHYLVKEFTGNWWIQFFTDGKPRVFLRIQRPLCVRSSYEGRPEVW